MISASPFVRNVEALFIYGKAMHRDGIHNLAEKVFQLA